MKITVIFLILTVVFFAFGQAPQKKSSVSKLISKSSPKVREAIKNFDFNSLSINPNNLTRKDIEDLRSDFLPAVKPLLIAQGEQVERLARIAEPVLQFHKADKSQVIVFDSGVPTVFTWKESFVTFSSGAMNVLIDDEIAALIAHEIGHLYFAEALAKARAEENDSLMQIIELKCDLVAFITLSKLGIEPSNLISALKKLIEKRNQLQIDSFQSGSPALDDRQEILDAYLKRIKDKSDRKKRVYKTVKAIH